MYATAARALLLPRSPSPALRLLARRGVKTEARLLELGVQLPPAGVPKGNFVMAARSGKMVYLSGHLPTTADGKLMTGKASVVCGVVGALGRSCTTVMDVPLPSYTTDPTPTPIQTPPLQVGAEVSVEEAQTAAKLIALNLLSSLKGQSVFPSLRPSVDLPSHVGGWFCSH